jgi:hypothetical protein
LTTTTREELSETTVVNCSLESIPLNSALESVGLEKTNSVTAARTSIIVRIKVNTPSEFLAHPATLSEQVKHRLQHQYNVA